MKCFFMIFAGTLFYMELICHLLAGGSILWNVIFLLPVLMLLAAAESMAESFSGKKWGRRLFYVFLAVEYVFYAAQLVYLSIFKQPLLFAAVGNAGADALTNYWRETLQGLWNNGPGLLLLALPLLFCIVLDKKGRLPFWERDASAGVLSMLWGVIGGCAGLVVLVCGYYMGAEAYHDYQGYYDSLMLVEEYGIAPVMVRGLLGDLLPEAEKTASAGKLFAVEENEPAQPAGESAEKVPEAAPETAPERAEERAEESAAKTPQVLDIDFDRLTRMSTDKEYQKAVATFASLTPTETNEYTGKFAGYNLIYLTAEGFSPYAVSEELTPTLYRLLHSGIVAENYYIPLWQTSTSDGEYVNLTGLIPNQQFSMKRSGENQQPYSLAAYFAEEGAACYAFHNGTLSYYDRYISHENMGYHFMAATPGKLSEAAWGDHIFPMENPDQWPASDLEMMKATLPYYIGEERFHVYYITISGHLNYNFRGNSMSAKNRELVEELPYSEEGRAYIACNIELDRALEYLIEELACAGKLEETVIVLSADHYPYGMQVNNYEELAQRKLEGTLDIYRNGLIFWNSEMEQITVEKPCCSVDILPTILNLFGFSYDSRLYAGRDMLSQGEGLVIFSDRSFVTDSIEYNKKKKEVIYKTEDADEETLEKWKQQVKLLYDYSAAILKQDFYKYVKEAEVRP